MEVGVAVEVAVLRSVEAGRQRRDKERRRRRETEEERQKKREEEEEKQKVGEKKKCPTYALVAAYTASRGHVAEPDTEPMETTHPRLFSFILGSTAWVIVLVLKVNRRRRRVRLLDSRRTGRRR